LILDVATGTGDLAFEQLRTLKSGKIIGVDVSMDMLNRARSKVSERHHKHLEFILENSENLSFPNNTFDAVSVAFGVRNFANLKKGLGEIYRVLKKDGQIMILEFSNPNNILVKSVFKLYFHNVLPKIGKWISRNDQAYKYLPDSVEHFPPVEKFIELLKEAGFKKVECEALSLGICSIYTGVK
jgi:demethylmenaquinone methyltransferase / 2-methoxy-6-polyprenyl-1,4-benzoquinol methylase